jgi:predicted transcriptional regulator of viral defense system
MVEDLSSQVLFALAAVILHGTVSAEDLSMILNVTNKESQLLLNRLLSRGLLVRVDGLFTINHLMYRQIVRVLKERNIIHLV